MEVTTIMRALDPEVGDAVWAAVEALLPVRNERHPLGCHRPRKSDRACFEVMLVRLATGCSWEDAERICGSVVSDTTARARRDEWMEAGVFDAMANEALAAYDKVVGLNLAEVAIDGSVHKAPLGGEGTGKSPVDRAKLGWKWSIATDTAGIPLAWAAGGANAHDDALLAPTLDALEGRGLLVDVATLHLDRGYDSAAVRAECAGRGLDDLVLAKRKWKKHRYEARAPRKVVSLGLRWPVERTNSWLSNYGQMRRNTDRRSAHRLAQLALAIVLIITAKLIDWRNRWSPNSTPIR